MARFVKEMVIIFLAVVAALYLIFPQVGMITDVIPFIGGLDEATAALIVLNTLKYYGLDLTNLYGSSRRKIKQSAQTVYVQPRSQSEEPK